MLLHFPEVEQLRALLELGGEVHLEMLALVGLLLLVAGGHFLFLLAPINIHILRLLVPEVIKADQLIGVSLCQVILLLFVPLPHLPQLLTQHILLQLLDLEPALLRLNIFPVHLMNFHDLLFIFKVGSQLLDGLMTHGIKLCKDMIYLGVNITGYGCCA